MAAVDDIRARIDLDQVAGLLGTDRGTAQQALDEALESLVGSMADNAGRPDEAERLAYALGDHAGAQPFDAGDRFDLSNVDTADGEKIVGHVYPGGRLQAASTPSGGGLGGLVKQLLPILAPIVMAYLANRMRDQMGGRSAPQGPQAPQGDPGQGGLGGILDDLLGGIFGQQAPQAEPAPAPRHPEPRQPAPPQRPTSDTVTRNDGLRMDEGPGDDYVDPGAGRAQAPQSGAGGVLGQILQDMLRGR